MWNFVGFGVSGLSSIVSSILLSAIIGIASFGAFSLIVTTSNVVIAIVGFNMRPIVTKNVATDLATNKDRAGDHLVASTAVVAGFSLVGALVMYLDASWISTTILRQAHYATYLRWNALLIFCSPITTTLLGGLAGLHQFKALGASTAGRGMVGALGVVGGGLLASTTGAVAGAALAELGILIANVAILAATVQRLEIRVHPSIQRHAWGRVRNLLGPVYLTNIVIMFGFWGGSILLAHEHNGVYELGLFSLASRFYAAAILPTTVIGTVAFPLLAADFGRRDRRAFLAGGRRFLLSSIGIAVLTSAALICGSMLIHLVDHRLPSHFYGDLVILALTVIPYATNGAGGGLLVAAERLRWWWISDIVLGIVLIATAWALVGSLGSVGLAWSYFAAYAISTVVMLPAGTPSELRSLLTTTQTTTQTRIQ